MSRWLSLAEDGGEETHTPPDNMTKPDITPPAVASEGVSQPKDAFCQVLSDCQVKAEQSQSPAEILKFTRSPLPPEVDDMRHGIAINGYPKTWTGKIVSLADWRRLSEWEKHGPNGRHWTGLTKQWEKPE